MLCIPRHDVAAIETNTITMVHSTVDENIHNKEYRTINIYLPNLGQDIQRIVEQLSQEELIPPRVLADELETYIQDMSNTTHSEFFDLQTAKRVAVLCGHLLDALPTNPSERQHHLTQLAIHYFVLEEDAEDDNDSLIGFDDDLLVAITVIEELGLHDLLSVESTDG